MLPQIKRRCDCIEREDAQAAMQGSQKMCPHLGVDMRHIDVMFHCFVGFQSSISSTESATATLPPKTLKLNDRIKIATTNLRVIYDKLLYQLRQTPQNTAASATIEIGAAQSIVLNW